MTGSGLFRIKLNICAIGRKIKMTKDQKNIALKKAKEFLLSVLTPYRMRNGGKSDIPDDIRKGAADCLSYFPFEDEKDSSTSKTKSLKLKLSELTKRVAELEKKELYRTQTEECK